MTRTRRLLSTLMLVVGLTGGIATGKSSVSNLLKAKQIPLIDADVLAREVVAPGTAGLAKIVAYFGPEILLPDGSLDRKKLGSIIFNDEAKRRKLNSIVHPAVRRAMLWGVVKNWIAGSKYCVLDVPLLIESGLWKYYGKVVVVFCSPEVQLQRLMKRDNSSHEEASARLNSQLPITDKVLYADHVVDNAGTPEDLEIRVNALIQLLDKEAGWSWRLSWLFPPFGLLSAAFTLARKGCSWEQEAQDCVNPALRYPRHSRRRHLGRGDRWVSPSESPAARAATRP
ncbi:CoaE-domain-containing protein [Mycena chlorophos]|uniref:CoaE-domain-containing protein n=1 Tax=Mycena chlorophos TaxID=658473 RepID=A0A8H6WIH4_MYCCL|nr:CoaE-domain-containing protein [Mycena chlorophos]